MTAPYRKKLIEVGLPLIAINAESAREKSIRHGHPSTLHLWWARRPLAACRAVLFASLVNDPDDDPMYGVSEDIAASERAKLFNLIEELVKWENSNNPDVINRARAEIARSIAANKVADSEWKNEQSVVTIEGKTASAHDFKHKLAKPEFVNAFLAEHAPPVLDPFAGGGSIPLEAQRLGLRAYASDLNPVPVLINKALIEIPPKFAGRPPVNPASRAASIVVAGADKGKKKQQRLVAKEWPGATGLAEDVRYYGKWMRDEAEKRIGHLYPKVEVTAAMAQDRPDLLAYVGQKLTVIAWIWARTVASPSPVYQGCHIPLVSSFWLGKKPDKAAWVEPIIDRENRTFRFVVRTGNPTAEERKVIDVGTKIGRGCKFRCLLSEEPIPESNIKEDGNAGRMNSMVLAVVAEGVRGRVYLSPNDVPQVVVEKPVNLHGIDAPLANDPRNLWCLGYGLNTFDKLFTARQLLALFTFSDLVREARTRVSQDVRDAVCEEEPEQLPRHGTIQPSDYADGIATYLAFGVSRSADFWSTIATWSPAPKNELVAHAFTKQAIPMTWDFAEANPFSESGGNFTGNLGFIAKVIANNDSAAQGEAQQLDATAAIGQGRRSLISTDPPYYDNIGYSDLSDYFYVWLRCCLNAIYPSIFSTLVTPKSTELIASPYRHPGGVAEAQTFFEEGLGRAFGRMRQAHDDDFPLTVYYAFKQSESEEEADNDLGNLTPATASTGWETMLSGLVRSGFTITGTWPMRTERSARSVGLGTNALASSIVLVCRARPENASLATRKEFITVLRRELPDALRNLQRGNIAPVDLAQAAIGPGMAVFTRYAKVMESDGGPMTVRTALGLINQSLDEVLAEQEGEFDGDTRWALAWFEQFGLDEGPFGDAETLSKAKNTAINGLVEAGIVTARAGKVRLVRREELNADWNPLSDNRLTVWETTQHLIRRLEKDGESAAATLIGKLGGTAEIARDLAYRLYSLCERKKWAQYALAYNSLVVAWPELTKLARTSQNRAADQQKEMEFNE